MADETNPPAKTPRERIIEFPTMEDLFRRRAILNGNYYPGIKYNLPVNEQEEVQ